MSLPISSPRSRSLLCFTSCRCFRCRSRAAARTLSRRTFSSGLSSWYSDCGGWGWVGTCCCACCCSCSCCCCCCCWRATCCWFSSAAEKAIMPIPAFLRSLSLFRRWRSAAFSRFIFWLSVSLSLGLLRDELDGGSVSMFDWDLWIRGISLPGFYFSMFSSINHLHRILRGVMLSVTCATASEVVPVTISWRAVTGGWGGVVTRTWLITFNRGNINTCLRNDNICTCLFHIYLHIYLSKLLDGGNQLQ